jgi:hypothetical protein
MGVDNLMIFALRAAPVDLVLGKGVPELSIDWLHAMRSWSNGGRSQLASVLLYRTGWSSWRWVTCRFMCSSCLEHPHTFQRVCS